MTGLTYFYHLDKIPNHRLSEHFPGLYQIRWRAQQVLKRRPADSFGYASNAITEWIDEFKEYKTKEEIEKYIDRRVSVLFSDGGWELGYLPRQESEYQYPLSEAEIRDLLENWPAYADEKLDLPSVDDIEDLEALQEILSSGVPYDSIDGFKGASEFELYAVLALMQLDTAASHIRFFHGDHELKQSYPLPSGSPKSLVSAANSVVRAMETICYAERNLSDVQLSKMREEMRTKIDDKLRAQIRRENAREGGLAKNSRSNQAQEFVRNEWALHGQDYKNNKSAFARDYARRVKHELGVDVTEKTIREVWLKDTPSAGTQAG